MKILVLTSRFPYPIEKGDKLRIYYQIRELAKRHEVCLFSLSEIPISAADQLELGKFCQEIRIVPLPTWEKLLRLFKGFILGHPFQTAYFYRRAALRELSRFVASCQPDLLYCQLLRMAPYAMATQLPRTLDYMDCFSMGMQRQAEKTAFPVNLIYRREARILKKYEAHIFSHFHHHSIISTQDRDHMSWASSQDIQVVPNGVDLDFFSPLAIPPTYELVFVGNMGYFPNVQAAKYLVQKILPLVWQQHADCKVLIAGARPSPDVQRLAQDSRVTVSGWMEDIREAYASGHLFVAPLFTGSGQQNKILEAMAMGVPCLTSGLVNMAIGAKAGQSILLAETPETFAQQILSMLDQPSKLKEIRVNGLEFIKRFSWEESVLSLEKGFFTHNPSSGSSDSAQA
ncbi:MAG: glycosyltransferase [Bacteroidota bacterium]